jgi:LytR cell envelope-related transcriptional attenuator
MAAYRTRRPMPAVLLAVILSTAAGLVWASVLHPALRAGGCPVAAETTSAAVTPGQRLGADSLDSVSPAPPGQVRVQVFNANGMGGVAAITGGRLSELGFAPTGTPANDPLHPALDLPCHGEIRFGVAGQAAARTLSLVMPCAELIRDVRPDSTVDLALGTKFTTMRPNSAALEALRGLDELGHPAPTRPSPSGQAAQAVAPAVDPDLFRLARQVTC